MFFTKSKKKSSIFLIAIFLLLALFLILLFTGSAYRSKYEEEIHPGIKILKEELEKNDKVSVSLAEKVENNTLEKAEKYLKEKLDPQHNKVVFQFEDKEWQYNLKDFMVNYNVKESIGEVRETWSSQSIFKVTKDLLGLVPFEEELSILPEYDLEKTKNNLEEINAEIKVEPKDAEFFIDKENNDIEIQKSRKGISLDIEKNLEKLDKLFGYYQVFLEEDTVKTELEVKDLNPDKTRENLEEKNIEKVLASFKTEFSKEEKGRSHNITLASDYFDKIILEPSETLSFNKVLSSPRESRKFREAPVLVDGELVPGIGGGLCQVSSTLYNASLYAGLEIIERHNHGRPIDYLSLGRDAAVAYDYLDLKVKNPFENSLLISSFVEEHEEYAGTSLIYFKIFGASEDEENYSIRVTDYEEIPPPVEYVEAEDKEGDFKGLNQEGKPGYKITTWRIKRDNEGNEIDREHLSDDHYNEIPTKYKVGEDKLNETEEEN